MNRLITVTEENLHYYIFVLYDKDFNILSEDFSFIEAEIENDIGSLKRDAYLSLAVTNQCKLFNGNIIKGFSKY